MSFVKVAIAALIVFVVIVPGVSVAGAGGSPNFGFWLSPDGPSLFFGIPPSERRDRYRGGDRRYKYRYDRRGWHTHCYPDEFFQQQCYEHNHRYLTPREREWHNRNWRHY